MKPMTYELAKKLKDAGFPQDDEYREGFSNCDGYGDPIIVYEKGQYAPKPNEECYVPSLSELIDFVDGSDKLNDIENDYIQKALLKLQGRKNE